LDVSDQLDAPAALPPLPNGQDGGSVTELIRIGVDKEKGVDNCR